MGNDILKRYNLLYWREVRPTPRDILNQYNLENKERMNHFYENDLYDLLPVEATLGNNIANGINASRGWQTTEEYSLPGGLPIKRQGKDDAGCTQAVIRSIHEYFGGQHIELENVGADFRVLATNLRAKNEISFSVREFHRDLLRIGRELEKGHPAVVTYPIGDPMPHTVGINRIYIQERERAGERARERGPRRRTIIQVMDPMYPSYRILPEWEFERGAVRLAVHD